MPSDGPTAFISYSRADSEFVLRMARDLKAAGAQVWLDQLDIEPGQRWARALQDAITNSPRFLVVLSPHSVDSTNVEDEVAFALEERKTIIPVLYCDCKVPFQLRPFQYADFRTDYESGLRILLKTMGVDLPAGFTPSSAVVEQKMVPLVDEHALAAEKTRQEELAREAAEKMRLAQEQKAAEEKARLQAERKAAAEQEKERKAAAEKARLEQDRKAAAEKTRKAEEARASAAAAERLKKARDEKEWQERKRKAAEAEALEEEELRAIDAMARKEAEAKAAAEKARLERERNAAAELARKEAAAKAAAAEEARLAAEETRKVKAAQSPSSGTAAVSIGHDTGTVWSPGKKIGAVAFGVLFAILAYIFLFKSPSRPTEQPEPARVKEFQLKPKPEENKQGVGEETRPTLTPSSKSTSAVNGPTGTSSENTGTPLNGKETADRLLAAEQLLGDHKFSLQWISWDVFGKATVTDENGRLVIKGEQRKGDQFVTIDGTITSVEPKSFVFHGTIVTKANDINKGNLCTRQGTMRFAATGARRYWRLQQMDNPCDQVTDYVDIYMR